MERLNARTVYRSLVVTLIALFVIGSTTATLADNVQGTIGGGDLTGTVGTPDASNLSFTLDGTDKVRTYTVPITVTDATGSGAGWNLTLTSTTFSTGGGTPHTLSTSASTINTAPSVADGPNSSNTEPSGNTVTYAYAVPAGATTPTATKFFTAAANSGMGSFTVTPTVSVAIPANVFAGTYTSTITIALVSAP